MGSLKIKDLLRLIDKGSNPRLHSLIFMCKHILDENENIYAKNLYKFFYKKCKLDEIELYLVSDSKFYILSLIEEAGVSKTYLKGYNLKDIKSIELKEYTKYQELHLELMLTFNNDNVVTLNNIDDTVESGMSDKLGEVILELFNKIK